MQPQIATLPGSQPSRVISQPISTATLSVAAVGPATEVVDEVARLLDDQPFMAGDALSLADLMLAPHLVLLPHFAEGQAILSRHNNLAAWIKRMEARPSMATTTWDRLNALAAQEAVAA